MKDNVTKYPRVKTLPQGAMTVQEFADSKGVTTAYIYKLQKDGMLAKLSGKFIVFGTYNFIIPTAEEIEK